MSNDIELNVKEKLSLTPTRWVVWYKRTCSAHCIHKIHWGWVFKRLISSCKNLPGKITGEEIFRVTDVYIRENNLRWEDCVSICTDGAALMTGKVKDFKAKVREVNPEIRFDHCFLYREATVAKMLPILLQSVLDEVVKIVNFVKSRPLNSRLFSVPCQEMGSNQIFLLLHTVIRWLSRGKSLLRVF
jgi:hypothetical protein